MPAPSATVSVRPARVDEAAAIARIQIAAWRADQALTDERLDALDAADLTASGTWRSARHPAPGTGCSSRSRASGYAGSPRWHPVLTRTPTPITKLSC